MQSNQIENKWRDCKLTKKLSFLKAKVCNFARYVDCFSFLKLLFRFLFCPFLSFGLTCYINRVWPTPFSDGNVHRPNSPSFYFLFSGSQCQGPMGLARIHVYVDFTVFEEIINRKTQREKLLAYALITFNSIFL